MAKRSYTEEERTEALNLYESHGPSAVEKKLGIPKGTVTGWAKTSNVRTVRTERTAHAVEAVIVDNKLRRQNIAARLYSQAETTLGVLEAETFRTLVRGAGGAESEEELTFIPTAERRTLVQTVQIALKTTHEIDARDSDDGSTAGRSMLEMLAKQLEAVSVVDPNDSGGESEAVALPEDE